METMTEYGILEKAEKYRFDFLDLDKVKRRVLKASEADKENIHPVTRVYRVGNSQKVFWYRIQRTEAVRVSLGLFWITLSFKDGSKRIPR